MQSHPVAGFTSPYKRAGIKLHSEQYQLTRWINWVLVGNEVWLYNQSAIYLDSVVKYENGIENIYIYIYANIQNCNGFVDTPHHPSPSLSIYIYDIFTLQAIKSIWIEFLCFQGGEIDMIYTFDCCSTKPGLTLAGLSHQCQVGLAKSKSTD